MKKRSNFKMKGFRSSPLKVSEFDNLTEEERERLYEQMKEEESERAAASDKRLQVHNVDKDREGGSAY
tara:strand:- start:370 stop:573 length:204 start_codon:yes stop_codon:yes gene_type:complete